MHHASCSTYMNYTTYSNYGETVVKIGAGWGGDLVVLSDIGKDQYLFNNGQPKTAITYEIR